jgi:hypothetical protein
MGISCCVSRQPHAQCGCIVVVVVATADIRCATSRRRTTTATSTSDITARCRLAPASATLPVSVAVHASPRPESRFHLRAAVCSVTSSAPRDVRPVRSFAVRRLPPSAGRSAPPVPVGCWRRRRPSEHCTTRLGAIVACHSAGLACGTGGVKMISSCLFFLSFSAVYISFFYVFFYCRLPPDFRPKSGDVKRTFIFLTIVFLNFFPSSLRTRWIRLSCCC